MEKLAHIEGVAASFPLINVNTDMIIPKQFLKSGSRTGYARTLFHDLRFNQDGSEREDFILNRAPYRDAKVLVAGDNFGCGSSREHAVWALNQFGIRCIVAPSFSDVFASNCALNSIVAIMLDRATVHRIARHVEEPASAVVRVDLQKQRLALSDGSDIHFEIDPFRKSCLLEGLDSIGITLKSDDSIDEFERQHWVRYPWLSPTCIRELRDNPKRK